MRTALYDRHVALGAKMVEFAGWEMPLSYAGVVAEHLGVRREVGLFDVSHMGYIEIKGDGAEGYLDFVSTNVIRDRPDLSAIYTVFSSDSGGCIDDAIVFRRRANHFFLVVNASNRQRDLEHFRRVAKGYRVSIMPGYETHSILALQGPAAKGLLARVLGYEIPLKAMQFSIKDFDGDELIISRTGYTGSFGYELIGARDLIVRLWDALLENGKEDHIQPAGLGARDTLRLEAGYALFGHELAADIAPTESVSEWTVRWKKSQFLGREALIRLAANPKKRSQHAIALIEKGVPRQGNCLYRGGRQIGIVTSGSFSPCLNRGIAIVMVTDNLALGEKVDVEIRGQKVPSEVVKLPFYKG